MSFVKRRITELLLVLLLGNPALADIALTQLANEGVLIDNGQTRVMIDGMVVEPYSIYAGLPPTAAADFDAVTGLFAGIDLVLVSHRHHDHNQPAFACNFMHESELTTLHTSSQVIGLMREKCREFVTGSPRVAEIDPQPGRPVVIEHGGARVTAYRLSHGRRKYAKIEHLAHLVEMGGVSVLHIGDASMDPPAFDSAGLAGIKADVAIIPFWFFQPGPGAALVEAFLDAPLKLAAHVPPDEAEEARHFLAEQFPHVKMLDPLERIRVAARVQPDKAQ